MKKLRIALAQTDCRLGEIQANLQSHLQLIEEARQADADLLVFPELSLTGYHLRDLVPMVARSLSSDDEILGPLLAESKSMDLVVSFVERGRRGRLYISAAYLTEGQIGHLHRKVYLPTYGLFEEGRFFAPGNEMRAFDTRFGRLGLLICEDFWHVSSPYLLWRDGADLLLFISASPSRGLSSANQLGSVTWVERVNQAYAGLFTTFVAHTVRVGFEDGLMFGGRATVFDPNGELISAGPYHQAALTVADLDLSEIGRSRLRLPLLRDERFDLVQAELERQLNRDHPTRETENHDGR